MVRALVRALVRVMGRAVGGANGYAYSAALTDKGGAWDAASLDAFLADPQAFAPGTSMEAAPLPDAASRARLIEFLGE